MGVANISFDLAPKNTTALNFSSRFHNTLLFWNFLNYELSKHPHAHSGIDFISDNVGVLLIYDVHEDMHIFEEAEHCDRIDDLVPADGIAGVQLTHLYYERMQLFLVVVVCQIVEGPFLWAVYLYFVRILQSHWCI